MSVTTSPATLDPPPLLFRQPSPSPFNAAPLSPNPSAHSADSSHSHSHSDSHSLSAANMASLPPPPDDHDHDIDMTTSTTLPRQDGQNHDRQDADMAGAEDTAGSPVLPADDSTSSGHADSDDESEDTMPNEEEEEEEEQEDEDEEEEDVMDTTPDLTQLHNLPAVVDAHAAHHPPPPPPPTISSIDAQTPASNNVPPVRVPSPQPPPSVPHPPPPDAHVEDVDEAGDDDFSDEDQLHSWHPIHEDTSAPDERELRDIEAHPEHSALEHEYWEKKTFTDLDDPEYIPGPTGRIEWTVPKYNGSRDSPNKELVMRSHVVRIGGYDWQIKFYPKGNDTDHLSVYIDCLTVTHRAPAAAAAAAAKQQSRDGSASKLDRPADELDNTGTTTTLETQFTPLPLLDTQPLPKRPSVAAQASVVVYNPNEPRVHCFRSCAHRFCPDSADWGWTRYHPIYEIHHRLHGQRQALLRNDTLSFTAYIRIVDDHTGCLWEHGTTDNSWDSFAMTGLQSLYVPRQTPGGNLVSAVSTWILLKPFRDLITRLVVPDPSSPILDHPKPFIVGFQYVLYRMRTQVQPRIGKINIDWITWGFRFYGIYHKLEKMDVIEIWEVLRTKMEQELRGTWAENALTEIFGERRQYAAPAPAPTYKIPVKGLHSIQEAVDASENMLSDTQELPQVLTLELARQQFDVPTRTWNKLTNEVTLDESIVVRGTSWTLFGLVAHSGDPQSGLYKSVLRPNGPDGGKWYSYLDSREEYKVVCLTRRQALTAHEGSRSKSPNSTVAYAVIYIRNDMTESAFFAPEIAWKAPAWMPRESMVDCGDMGTTTTTTTTTTPPPPPLPPPTPPVGQGGDDYSSSTTTTITSPSPSSVDAPCALMAVDSRVFSQHEGPGFFDPYDPKWRPESSDLIHSIRLKPSDTWKVIESKLASVFGVQDPRQCKFWIIRAGSRETELRPSSTAAMPDHLDASESWVLGRLLGDPIKYQWCIWVHVLKQEDLPPLAPPPPLSSSSSSSSSSSTTQGTAASAQMAAGNAFSRERTIPPPPLPPPPPQAPPPPAAGAADDELMGDDRVTVAEDTPMREPLQDGRENNAAAVVPAPVAVEIIHTGNGQTAELMAPVRDADMADVLLAVAVPPSPPPAGAILGNGPPRADDPIAPTVVPHPPNSATEVYFFLKFFDYEHQRLESRGFHAASKSARLDTAILKILDLPHDTPLNIDEEEDIVTVTPLRARRSFEQNKVDRQRNRLPILIASPTLTGPQRIELAARGAFFDTQALLRARANARNFPGVANGHFSFAPFGGESYVGEIKHHHMHGHGTRVYHTGNSYTGAFVLNQRHGHGVMTFQNGDTYTGEWADDQQHGQGTYIEASTGNTYVGGWRHDKRHGEGVTHWKSAQETEKLCRICWDDDAEAAFYDCGHVVACLPCARRVDVCPVCRKRVLSCMKLYYV
ncbi:hypothetical protein EJ05DRAFT_81011 [Pseudovirgaria hyperparasitica]|uniref:RING-type domain-containing protein n=1 Tax=Pseudovirgaria hyperparasitica TaxID=470096 RepID=A0A6A6W4A8_9PEZI|nr:uncharacterized protein EJ05DRAFT_81011 [Pseudovirgaria hyperparasitica]KAF2755881.1 hypothetical protein EJ05DRAFT_81011 [Pseudovirgaria hyperparasitica]